MISIKSHIRRALKAISVDHLRDVVIPDPVDGEISLDYLLMTPSGLLVVDVRETQGSIFASEGIDEWTVLGPKGRYTIRNPLHDIKSRMFAVKLLAKDIPIDSALVFAQPIKFQSTPPPGVFQLKQMKEQFSYKKDANTRQQLEAFTPVWNEIKKIAQPIKY
ncbi:MAG: NERD domain-containing protein [Gammaproteobacteria bacterium]|nr:NERD domain-containing protein [Gammaproteobacteria bacterium]